MPVEVTYRNVERTDATDAIIEAHRAKLEKTCGYITSLRIAIEKPQKHQRGGRPYRVRLDIRVPPGHEIVVREEQSGGDSRAQLPTIIKQVFNAARRRLETLKERQRGEVKRHKTSVEGQYVY